MNDSIETPLSRRARLGRRRKQQLIDALGGRCHHCGSPDRLQFDCITSQGPDHHSLGWTQRLAFYEAQRQSGNLQLLCPRCHVAKTLHDIARRTLAEARAVCPVCGHFLKLAKELTHRTPPQVDFNYHAKPQ